MASSHKYTQCKRGNLCPYFSETYPTEHPTGNYYDRSNSAFRICGKCRRDNLTEYGHFKTKTEHDRAERRDDTTGANAAPTETAEAVTPIDLLSSTDRQTVTEMLVEIDRNDYRSWMEIYSSSNIRTPLNFFADSLNEDSYGNFYAETCDYNYWQDANGNYHQLCKLGITKTNCEVDRLHNINRGHTGKPGIIKYTHMIHLFDYKFIEKFAEFYFSDRIVPGRAKEWYKITRDECDALFNFLAKYPTAKMVEDSVLDSINEIIVSRILRG
jgi:hypothetical protein